MTEIKAAALAISLIAAAVPAGSAEEAAQRCGFAAYEIMSVLVSSEYLPDFGLIVINRETEAWCLRSDLGALFETWPDLKKETADSLIVGNSRGPAVLEDKFDIAAKILLVPQDEYINSLADTAAPDWDSFDRAFPDAQGYLTFSRAGFDAGCTQALVIFSNAYRCSGTSLFPAGRKIAYFRKEGGSWRLIGISRGFDTLNR